MYDPVSIYFPLVKSLVLDVRAEAGEYFSDGVCLDDLTSDWTRIGGGKFSDIYAVRDGGGARFVFKAFRGEISSQAAALFKEMLLNLRLNHTLFAKPPFLAPRIIPQHGSWYIRDYGDGVSVGDAALTPRTKALAVAAYATALDQVHRAACCMVDNNWGALLVSPTATDMAGFSLCDYDVVTPQQGTANAHVTRANLNTPCTRSQEQLLLTPQTPLGDLEALALMTDVLYNRMPWLCVAPKGSMVLAAQENRRAYPLDRRQQLPSRLRHVVEGLLTYPREASITADDFVHAATYDAERAA